MGTGDLCRVPPAAVHPGRVRQCSGTRPCGYCRRALWVPVPRGQYSGKICFIEKPGVHDEGGRHEAKRSSDPRVAYPEVSVQVRDLVRVVGIRGKFVLSIGSQKQYTRSLVLPSWRHETCSGALCEAMLSGKFHPRYFPVEFAGIFRPGKYAQSGKYGKYDFGLVIM